MKQKLLNVWIDFHESGDIGIECDEPSVTFDGQFICLFPKKKDETNSDGAMRRANLVLKYMRGQRQAKR